jgi:hypothetical protein
MIDRNIRHRVERGRQVRPQRIERHPLFIQQGDKNLLCGSCWHEGDELRLSFNDDALGRTARIHHTEGKLRFVASERIAGAMIALVRHG